MCLREGEVNTIYIAAEQISRGSEYIVDRFCWPLYTNVLCNQETMNLGILMTIKSDRIV